MHFNFPTTGRRCALVATLAFLTACEAPEGLSAARPFEPSVDGTLFVVGITTTGEGRARLPFGTSIYQGVAGTRAYLTNGNTTIRVPTRRVNNEPDVLLVDGLTAGTTYQVTGVVVNNVGIESILNAEGPQALVVPAAKSDVTAPSETYMSAVENYGDSVSVRWDASFDDDDVFQYIVERSTGGGAFTSIGSPVRDGTAPHFNDVTAAATPGTYEYRVVVEDLSGNLSGPSNTLSITVN